MEIYFDKKTTAVLKAIYKSKDKGVSLGYLQIRFGEAANTFLLIDLCNCLYAVAQDENSNYLDFSKPNLPTIQPSFRFFTTAKGNELLETKIFNFRKWVVPTLISSLSLAISTISAAIQLLS